MVFSLMIQPVENWLCHSMQAASLSFHCFWVNELRIIDLLIVP
jgi:hypothetical protein